MPFSKAEQHSSSAHLTISLSLTGISCNHQGSPTTIHFLPNLPQNHPQPSKHHCRTINHLQLQLNLHFRHIGLLGAISTVGTLCQAIFQDNGFFRRTIQFCRFWRQSSPWKPHLLVYERRLVQVRVFCVEVVAEGHVCSQSHAGRVGIYAPSPAKRVGPPF